MTHPESGMELAELLRRMDYNNVKNKNQLATLIGVNRSTTGRWLSGKTKIPWPMAAAIRAILRLPTDKPNR